jgi:hypothetical protein
MADVLGIANLNGTGTIPKLNTSHNTDGTQFVYRLIQIDNKTITAHNRDLSISNKIITEDVTLLSGNMRRFVKGIKKVFSLSFTFLPSHVYRTVDGQYGRDFLYGLLSERGTVNLYIQDSPNDAGSTYTVYVSTYKEDIVRREHSTQNYYYNLNIELVES